MLEEEPPRLCVLPVGRVLFPGQVSSYAVGKRASVALIDHLLARIGASVGRLSEQAARSSEPLLALALAREKGADAPVHATGTTACLFEVRSVQLAGRPASDAAVYVVVVQGVARVALGREVSRAPFLEMSGAAVDEDASIERPIAAAYGLALKSLCADWFRALRAPATSALGDVAGALKHLGAMIHAAVGREIDGSTLGQLADALAAVSDASASEKQAVLACSVVRERCDLVVGLLKRQIEVLRLSAKIGDSAKDALTRSQREVWLRGQLRAIRDELAGGAPRGASPVGGGGPEGDGGRDEVRELEERLRSADMPAEARATADRELRRLGGMHPMQSEHAVLLNYLDWLASMPWRVSSDDNADLDGARRVLDEQHHGLAKVKRRVYEHLAVFALRGAASAGAKGSILLLVGPPGVGKTSIGRSVAAALGRKFERISLGGVTDAHEIRGHRRTYVGAMPGLVAQAVRRCGTNNPVLMLDEVDKMGHDGRSDPASSLLEVLDAEQNGAFVDHFLNVPLDLSKVLFIATANHEEAIPPPLLDRMEPIHMSGYTLEEKVRPPPAPHTHAPVRAAPPLPPQVHIGRRHLLPKQLTESGLPPSALSLPDETLAALVDGYTREAGLRNLEREIAAICRPLAVRHARAPAGAPRDAIAPLELRPPALGEILGPRKYERERSTRLERAGVALGLAWTAAGGELLFIETAQMRGSGELILTGHLGEVMQESVVTALSWIRSHTAELGLDAPDEPPPPEPQSTGRTGVRVPSGGAGGALLADRDVHVHFPAGAIRKDGPSAGATTLVALVSLFTGRRARSDTAMSGEISLRGAVLPVGGVVEKVLGAHRAGVHRVLLPVENEKDLHELSEKVRAETTFIFCDTVEALLDHALMPAGAPEAELSAEPRKEPGGTRAPLGEELIARCRL